MNDPLKKYLSKNKFNELKIELEELKTKKRKEIAEKLEFAKSLGDLSENAEYHEARDEQAKVEERILIVEDILKNAEIVTDQHKDYVTVGSKVTIQEKGSSRGEDWNIVGSEESDLANNKISNESPLGDALIGKKRGDAVELKTPNGTIQYTISKIH